jgi:uncharacterized peroxidase-related enzyme
MSRLTNINPDQATGKAKELLDGVQAKLGMTPNMMRAMAASPAVLDAYLQFSGALGKGGLSAKVREQIALAVGQANRCEYCLAAHSAIGKMVGLTAEQIGDSRIGTAVDARTAATLRLSQRIVETRGVVTDADLAAARGADLNDGAIAEIVANVALNIFTNYFNHVAATDVDFPRAEPLSTDSTDVRSRLNELLDILKEGRMTEGQETYFADDVVTQEGNDAPVYGKRAAIERLDKFRQTIGVSEFLGYEVRNVAVVGNVSFYDSTLSLKLKSGDTIRIDQVVRTEWNHGKIVNERYLHG